MDSFGSVRWGGTFAQATDIAATNTVALIETDKPLRKATVTSKLVRMVKWPSLEKLSLFSVKRTEVLTK
jgi:hypothetical protein